MNYNNYFLYPSEIIAEKAPFKVTTILGSCVAVCLWDSRLKIGGINHFMIPLWTGEGLASPRYGDIAIHKLIQKMTGMGSKQYDLKAKIFGGGEIIVNTSNQLHVGERNIQVAYQMLRERNIEVISNSTGGKNGRKIQFFSDTGSVFLRYVRRNYYDNTK